MGAQQSTTRGLYCGGIYFTRSCYILFTISRWYWDNMESTQTHWRWRWHFSPSKWSNCGILSMCWEANWWFYMVYFDIYSKNAGSSTYTSKLPYSWSLCSVRLLRYVYTLLKSAWLSNCYFKHHREFRNVARRQLRTQSRNPIEVDKIVHKEFNQWFANRVRKLSIGLMDFIWSYAFE